MKTEALDSRLTFSMFVKNIGNKLKSIMAKTISPEEKLKLIVEEMAKDTQEKRVTARNIRAKMVALADPETAELEPLERLKVRREKLVALGSKTLKEKEALESEGKNSKEKSNQLKKITKEIKSLETSLTSLENTYETLKNAYDVALENYKVSLASYEHAKNNGQTLLFAIKAHQEALQMKDKANQGNAVDASFLTDLENELSKAQQELRSEKQLDEETERDESSVLDQIENEESDTKLMDEFRNFSK